MGDYQQCDIWLAESARHTVDGQKHKRPIIIISNNEYNDKHTEYICLHLTTRLDAEYTIPLSNSDFEKSRLTEDSAIRYDSINRYSKEFFSKKLGIIKKEKLAEAIIRINQILK